jgi:GntR family transcriptional regulator
MIHIEELAKEINKDSPIPYYIQLKDALLRFIEINQLKSEEQLPGEHDLCKIFDLSRTVIRQTLSILEQEGVIVRRKGIGAFIASKKITESLVQKLTGFYQDMTERGVAPVSKVLIQKVVPSNELVSEKLKIKNGTPVLMIERLRYIDATEPIVLVTTFLPYKMCMGIEREDLTHQSLYELLDAKYNIVIARGERTIEAVLPGKEQCRLLNITKEIPLIKLESISYLNSGVPIEYYCAYHRGDKSRFKVELVRVEERGKLKTPLSNNFNNIPESN